MAVTNVFESDYAFWGERDYVHGSHMIYGLFDAIAAWELNHIKHISASFRSNMKEQGNYLLYINGQDMLPFKETLYADFKISTRDNAYLIGLVGNGKSVTKRLIDDETVLIQRGFINFKEMSASITDFNRERFVNVIIALNKKIHIEILDEGISRRWQMARLDLQWGSADIGQVKEIYIRIEKNVGNRMTKSIVLLNGNKFGEIYFNRKV